MLVGGMKVVGIYIWVSESAFKNSTTVLCQVFYIIYLIKFDSEVFEGKGLAVVILGGISVLFCRITTIIDETHSLALLQTVKGVAEAAPVLEAEWNERLLVHICYSPRR